MEILSFGDLVQSGSYDVHSRFRRVVNMVGGRRFVSLVTPGVDAGPLNIVVRGLDPGSVRHIQVEADVSGVYEEADAGREHEGADVSGERGSCRAVILDGRRIEADAGRTYDSTLPPATCDLPRFRDNLRLFGTILVELAPPESLAYLIDPGKLSGFRQGFERGLADHVRHCVRDIFHGDTLRGVSRLKGCGVGLTPSGDDFLAGLLIATHLSDPARTHAIAELRARIFESARTSNVLSATFLYLAECGRVTSGMKELAVSLSTGTPHGVRRCAEHIVSVGATSGADTGVGLYLTLRSGFGRSAHARRHVVGGLREHHVGEAQWS